eukprot:10375919-Alexandrium_andersonii.AAC.1
MLAGCRFRPRGRQASSPAGARAVAAFPSALREFRLRLRVLCLGARLPLLPVPAHLARLAPCGR